MNPADRPVEGTRARVLLAGPDATEGMEALEAFAQVLGWPEGPTVRASMVSSLDGSAFDAQGTSRGLSSAADRAFFLWNRRQADVVLVGAGTFRAENYFTRSGPPVAVVTRGGALESPSMDAYRRAGLEAKVLAYRLGPPAASHAAGSLAQVVADLRARGFARIAVEGGPTLLGELIRAGLVDELLLSWEPVLSPTPDLAARWSGPGSFAPRRWRPAAMVELEGTLIGRWLAPRPGPA